MSTGFALHRAFSTLAVVGSLAAAQVSGCFAAAAESEGRVLAYGQPLSGAASSISEIRLRAQSAYQAGRFAQAAGLYQHLCNSSAASAVDFYWLAESHAHQDDFAQAGKFLKEALRLDNTSERYHLRYVEFLLSSHQRQAAMQACREASTVVASHWGREKLKVLFLISSKAEPELQAGATARGGLRRAATER